MDTERTGIASVALGAGRATKEDAIDPAAGIMLAAKTGAYLKKGDLMATLYAADEARLDEGERILREAYELREEEPAPIPHFFARVSRDGVDRLA